MKIPLLLNYAQCKLLNKEYYSVIEHCSTVLKTEPGSINLFIKLVLYKLYISDRRNLFLICR